MRHSLEIEKIENGFVVTIYGEDKEEKTSNEASPEMVMYPEPKRIAAKKEEIASIVQKWIGDKKEEVSA